MDLLLKIIRTTVLLYVILKSDRIRNVSGNEAVFEEHSRKVFVFLRVETDLIPVARLLEPSAIHYHQKITSLVHVFEDRNSSADQKAVISELNENNDLKRMGVSFEEDRQYIIAMLAVLPEDVEAVSYTDSGEPTFLKFATYSQIGVEHVWREGITGKGVTVVVNDVGVNGDIPDLQKNMLKERSFNFVSNNGDVSPEPFFQEFHCDTLHEYRIF